jgi:hypothetical protein
MWNIVVTWWDEWDSSLLMIWHFTVAWWAGRSFYEEGILKRDRKWISGERLNMNHCPSFFAVLFSLLVEPLTILSALYITRSMLRHMIGLMSDDRPVGNMAELVYIDPSCYIFSLPFYPGGYSYVYLRVHEDAARILWCVHYTRICCSFGDGDMGTLVTVTYRLPNYWSITRLRLRSCHCIAHPSAMNRCRVFRLVMPNPGHCIVCLDPT